MRVVSWNVRSLRDGPAAVAGILRDLDADVVLLQEAPRLLLWRLSRRRLARRSGLRLVTNRKAAGNAVLAAGPVDAFWARTFATPRGLHRRGTAGAVVRLAGRPVAVLGTHLDLDPAARLVTATAVRALAPDLPLVLGADVNEEPGGAAWGVLTAGLVDLGKQPTYPAVRAARRIDVLAASPSLSVQLEVQATAASDHVLLVADLEWVAD